MNRKLTTCLAPYADMFNHYVEPKTNRRMTNWYYDDDEEGLIIQALRDIEKGEEVFISYFADKIFTNDTFFLNYGFI